MKRVYTDDEILELLIFIEGLGRWYDGKNVEFGWYNFRYEYRAGCIYVESDWGCPEEGGCNSYQVDIGAGVIRYGESGSLVYGEYDNVGEVGFGALFQVYEYFKREYGYAV